MSGRAIEASHKRRKVALIRALLPSCTEIDACGCGRSVRTAATRALLNLLGHKLLRRHRVTNLQLQLSVDDMRHPAATSKPV